MAKRLIVIDGKEYRYKIGQMYVRITDPEGKSRAVDLTVVTGLSWDDIERGHWKKWLKITPADIARTIRGFTSF